jgi:hypothetical protein
MSDWRQRMVDIVTALHSVHDVAEAEAASHGYELTDQVWQPMFNAGWRVWADHYIFSGADSLSGEDRDRHNSVAVTLAIQCLLIEFFRHLLSVGDVRTHTFLQVFLSHVQRRYGGQSYEVAVGLLSLRHASTMGLKLDERTVRLACIHMGLPFNAELVKTATRVAILKDALEMRWNIRPGLATV